MSFWSYLYLYQDLFHSGKMGLEGTSLGLNSTRNEILVKRRESQIWIYCYRLTSKKDKCIKKYFFFLFMPKSITLKEYIISYYII